MVKQAQHVTNIYPNLYIYILMYHTIIIYCIYLNNIKRKKKKLSLTFRVIYNNFSTFFVTFT